MEAPQGFQKVKPGWGLPVPGPRAPAPGRHPAPSCALHYSQEPKPTCFGVPEAPRDSVRPQFQHGALRCRHRDPPGPPQKPQTPPAGGAAPPVHPRREGEWPGPERISCFPSTQLGLIALFRGSPAPGSQPRGSWLAGSLGFPAGDPQFCSCIPRKLLSAP